MKIYNFVLGNLILVLGLVSLIWAGPKLSVSEETWDFGDAPSVGNAVHTFKVKNIGDSTLVIDRVDASCGCISTGILQKELKPGESATLSAGFNFGYYSSGGKITKDIYIYSNDKSASIKSLSISANIHTSADSTKQDYDGVTVEPREISLRDSSYIEKKENKIVRIKNRGKSHFNVRVLEWAGVVENVKLKDKVLKPGGLLNIEVEISPDKFKKTLDIHSQEPAGKEIFYSSVTLGLSDENGERRISIPIWTWMAVHSHPWH